MPDQSPLPPSKPVDKTFYCVHPLCVNRTANDDALYCSEHAKFYQQAMVQRKPFSIGPDQRAASYGGAAGVLTMALAASAGIENPLHRTLAILACGLVAYLLGLRTQ